MTNQRTLSSYIVDLIAADRKRIDNMNMDKVAKHYGIKREWAEEYRRRELQYRVARGKKWYGFVFYVDDVNLIANVMSNKGD